VKPWIKEFLEKLHILRERTERLLEMINRERNVFIPRLRSPEVYVW